MVLSTIILVQHICPSIRGITLRAWSLSVFTKCVNSMVASYRWAMARFQPETLEVNTTINKLPIRTGGSYAGAMTLLSRNGEVAHDYQTCKETALWFAFQEIVMRGDIQIVGSSTRSKAPVNTKRPRFVMSAHPSQKEQRAERVLKVLNLLHQQLGLKVAPRVAMSTFEGHGGIAYTIDPWLFSCPLNLHATWTLVRLAVQRDYDIESIDGLVRSARMGVGNDADQLNSSRNWPGFLAKSLKCHKYNGRESWFNRLYRGSGPGWHGIVGYSNEEDGTTGTFTELELIKQYGKPEAKKRLGI